MAAVTSRGSVIPNLTKYLVPAEETYCGEYVYRMNLELKEYKDKKGNTKFKYEVEENFKIILSALLNSSGGIIQLVPQIPQKPLGDKDFDEWRNSLKDKLHFIPVDVFKNCISVHLESGQVFIMVNKANEFITVNSHLHSRHVAGNIQTLGYSSISQAVSSSTESRSKSIPLTGQFIYGDVCPAIENQKLEFKHYQDQSGIDEVDHLIKRLGNGRELKTLFGMANLTTGGDIVIGIAEDPETKANVYRGQRLSVTQENNFKTKLQDILMEVTNRQHIWGFKHAVPEEGKHWSCDFIPLQMPSPPGTPQERRVLIVIHIFHCPGGAFLDTPEAYSLNDDDQIENLNFEVWQEMHRRTTESVPEVEYLSQVENELKQPPPLPPVTQSVQNHPSNVPTVGLGQAAESSKISPDSFFRDNTSIRYTKHSSRWDGGREKQHPPNEKQRIEAIGLFKVSDPINYHPSRDKLQYILSERFHLPGFLSMVESTVQDPGFGIAADMFWLCLNHSCTKMQLPPRHVMDVLIVTESARMILAAAVEECNTSIKSCNAYKVKLARILKRRILEFLPFSYPFMIDCQLRNPDGSVKHCPDFIKECFGSEGVEQKKMLMLCSALASVLKNRDTCFRDLIFRDEDVCLSAEQMNILQEIDPNRFSIIEGPPGCGKTILARLFTAKKSKNAAYISASKALTNRAKANSAITAFDAQNSTVILYLLETVLTDVQHIVIDDHHRYTYTEDQLHELCELISKRGQSLHVFQDSEFQNYQHDHQHEANTLTMFLMKNRVYGSAFTKTMNTIYRNSQVVGSFLQTQISNEHISKWNEVKCESSVIGEDIIIQQISNLWNVENNGLLKHVKDILEPSIALRHHHYTYRDIVVLLEDNSTQEDVALFQTILKKNWPVQNAEEFPVRGLIVDTLHNFMGCESRVAIFVLSRNDNESQKTSSHTEVQEVQKIKHRIAVASRGIDRVDFLQESNLDGRTVEAMKCDVCPRNALVPRRMWTKHEWAGDYTWTAVAASTALALVHITRSGDIIRLVSESGESLPLQIDTAGIQDPCCVDSTPDGAAVLVVHRTGPHWWTVFRRESGLSYRRQATYQLQDQPSGRYMEPTAARWTHDGEIIMVVEKMSSSHLRKYRVSDGDLLWEVKDVGSFVSRSLLSVCQQSGHILLSPWPRVICVYSPAGELLHSVPLPDRLPAFYSVCAVRKDMWLSGHGDGSVRLWGVSDTARAEHVLVDTGESDVLGLALSGDRLLAVRTGIWVRDKLIVYNVAGCLE